MTAFPHPPQTNSLAGEHNYEDYPKRGLSQKLSNHKGHEGVAWTEGLQGHQLEAEVDAMEPSKYPVTMYKSVAAQP